MGEESTRLIISVSWYTRMFTPTERERLAKDGYIRLPGVLSKACVDRLLEEVYSLKGKIERGETRVPSCMVSGQVYQYAAVVSPLLRELAIHDGTWDIVWMLTGGMPKLEMINFVCNKTTNNPLPFHSGALTAEIPEPLRFFHDGNEIRCDNFVVFYYLTDVKPGDGGLLVVPGSHLANDRGAALLKSLPPTNDIHEPNLPDGVINVHANAGDAVILLETVVHGTLRWTRTDYDRVNVFYKYSPQYLGSTLETPDDVQRSFTQEFRELLEYRPPISKKTAVRSPVTRGSDNSCSRREESAGIRIHSESPMILTFENLLSRDTCSQLIAKYAPTLQGFPGKAGYHSKIFSRSDLADCSALALINFFLEQLVSVNDLYDFGMTMVRYSVGSDFPEHCDSLDVNDPSSADRLKTAGQDVMTLVVYLNEAFSGGETNFPRLDVTITPKTGSAVLFSNTGDGGQRDDRSLHASRPIVDGEKWILVKTVNDLRYWEGPPQFNAHLPVLNALRSGRCLI
jgi:hypothetical protein